MRKPVLAALTFLTLAAVACAPKKNTPIGEIPQLKSLEEVMDNQSTTADPQFAKMSASSFSDADFAGFAAAAERLQATSAKTKDFAAGRADFATLATRLGDTAKALGTASAAKDATGAKAALADMKATCRECHSKFR